MQLLQQRDFSSFFSDTFLFFKINGKHFFTVYFTLNSIFIFIKMIQFSLISNDNINLNISFTYMSYVFGMIVWVFSTVYIILYNKYQTKFNYKDVLLFTKSKINKILNFVLITILLFIPIVVILYITLFLSAITIFGPIIIVAAFFTWFSLAFYEALNTNKAVFDCFKYALKLLFKNFWAVTLSMSLIYFSLFLVYILMFSFIGGLSFLFEMNTTVAERSHAFFTALSTSKMLIVTTLLSILSVVVQISQGIIYFSQKEMLENISTNSEIDQIGKIEF